MQEVKPQTECCLLARLSRAQASEGKKLVITQLCWGVKGRRLYSVLELARYGSLDKLRQLVDSGVARLPAVLALRRARLAARPRGHPL